MKHGELNIAEEHPSTGATWRNAAALAVLASIAALPYLNSLSNGFVYDDDFQVLANPYLRSFHYLRTIFSTSVWSFLGGAAGITNYYRPMMSFGYLLCFQLFGPRPPAFHAVNLIVHVAVVLLVYGLTTQMFRNRRIALAAAVIFALHPVHSESVDWVGAVTDLELTLFYLAAFWFYLRIPRLNESRGRWIRMQSGVVIMLALAMLSKEQALTLPVLAVLYEHFYREDRSETGLLEKIARYAPMGVMMPAYLAVRMHFLGAFTPLGPSRPHVLLDELLLSAAALLGQYAGKILWPATLCMYYVFPSGWTALLPLVLGGFAAAVSGTLLFVLLWKHARMASFGLIWFAITLAPVLNIRWMPDAAFAERYLYLPSVGLAWTMAWALVSLWDVARRQGRVARLALALAGTALAVLAVTRIVTRNRAWKDETTLYRQTLQVSPDAYVIHTDLGKLYWDQGQLDLAEREWLEAARLAPDSVVTLNNLGLLLTTEHRYDEAINNLKRSIQLAPDGAMAHIDLGAAYAELGRQQEAEQELTTAVRLAPLSILARNQLGQTYLDEGRFAEAEAQFRASLAVQPSLSAWLGLGLARWRQGDSREAESDFKQAQAAGPSEGRIHFLLAVLYSSTGRRAEAMGEYQAGFRVDPANPQALAEFQKLKLEMSNANATGASDAR